MAHPSTRRLDLPARCVLLALVSGLLWLGLATTAQGVIQTEPQLIGADEPFRLVMKISGLEFPGEIVPRVEVDGLEILVHVRLSSSGVTFPPTPVSFTADVEGLPAGQYNVTILADTGDSNVEVESRLLDIGVTHISAAISPTLAIAGEPFELTLRGIAPAPCSDDLPYLEDGVLVVPIHLDCSVITPPPSPTPFEFVTPPITLPAGSYSVVAGQAFAPYIDTYLRSQIEVVAKEVPLHDGKFQVSVDWQDFEGLTGAGRPAVPPSRDSALFWFFAPENWELMVKVLDGCDFHGHYWVLGAASTTVGYQVTVQGPDSQSWTFANPLGQSSEAFADIEAFECEDAVPAPATDSTAKSFAELAPANLFHKLTIEPTHPVPGLPARAILEGVTSCCGAPGLRRVERLDGIIRLHLEFADGGITAFSNYLLSADLGFLDAGMWDLQAVGDPTPGEFVELDQISIEVAAGLRTRTVPERPLSDDQIHLFVEGFGTGPSLELDAIEGRRITALWSPGGCLSPPGLFDLSLPLGMLSAGEYQIQVRSWDDQRTLLGGTTLQVLGAPITVREARFSLDVDWRQFTGQAGRGRLVRSPSSDSTLFWFFSPDNWELMVKVLDGCDFNGHYWVLGAASTTVEYDLTVTDTELGTEWTFHNDLGVASPAFADTEAFPCGGESP